MPDFQGFKDYMRHHAQEVHEEIHECVLKSADDQTFDDAGEEHEFYRRSWVENGFMIMLEHYHNWLNGKG